MGQSNARNGKLWSAPIEIPGGIEHVFAAGANCHSALLFELRVGRPDHPGDARMLHSDKRRKLFRRIAHHSHRLVRQAVDNVPGFCRGHDFPAEQIDDGARSPDADPAAATQPTATINASNALISFPSP